MPHIPQLDNTGFALQLNPQKDYPQLYTVSQELQHILQTTPGSMLTILTTVDKRHYGLANSPQQVEWPEQKVMIVMSYPDLGHTDTQSGADLDSILMWAGHAAVGAMPLSVDKALELARVWEAKGQFVPIPQNFSGSYLCGSTATAMSGEDNLVISNRVWWSVEHQSFMVTEAYCLDPKSLNGQETAPLETRHHILTHYYPCPHWSLPVPTASILLGMDQNDEVALLNLRQGHRVAFINAQDPDGNWHPLFHDMCFRSQQSGLRSYIATHRPNPWIALRNQLGRHKITFIEEASEDPQPRQLLLWDYHDLPTNTLVNRYSQVGSVVWTQAHSLKQAAPLFPNYVVECHWPQTAEQHPESYLGTLIADGKTRVIHAIRESQTVY
ncbi:MAG: hypothetical protein WAN89_05910 [Lawsonella sp.]|nr:hypothetical protein [Mycobacteriales bacterium]